ncbi:MAG: PRC-barrel domain-containing protein [Verrucomicrobia bacterium]|nr:PRC-barrel domain-containing protein [Verrucomicrobiota bacterium]
MKIRSLPAVLAAIALTSSTAAFAAVDNTQNASAQWLVDASKLEGTAVWDFHGNKLGDLQEVLIDPQTGRIRYGVMEVDKSWSWSDPQIAIPWDSFAVKRGDDKKAVLSIDATKEKLEKAPKFKAGDADRLFSKESSQPIYSYWSVFWYEEPAASMKSNSDSSATNSSTTTQEEPNASTKANENADKTGTSGTTSSTDANTSSTSGATSSTSGTTSSTTDASTTTPGTTSSSSGTDANTTSSSTNTPAANNKTDSTKN